jgi:SAM-dependent methyltransferase
MLAAVAGAGDHVPRNRAAWDRWAAEYAGPGLRGWAQPEPGWGIWQIPEARVGVLPADLAGRDTIELGCGTGYVSAWLARRGARPVGLDNSAAQLATARQLQDRFGLRYPLIHASAEQAPLADARFDLAISEYGASIWCDPYAWIPEAARLLRPGGQLIFLVNSALLMLTVPDEDDQPATERLLRPYFGMHRFEWPGDESVEFHLGHGEMIRLLRPGGQLIFLVNSALLMLTVPAEDDQPATERLLRPYFGMHRFEWPGDESVEFHLGHGEMIRLLRGCGLEVEDLLELRPDPDATTRYPHVTLEWARQWPCEEVWKARKVR